VFTVELFALGVHVYVEDAKDQAPLAELADKTTSALPEAKTLLVNAIHKHNDVKASFKEQFKFSKQISE